MHEDVCDNDMEDGNILNSTSTDGLLSVDTADPGELYVPPCCSGSGSVSNVTVEPSDELIVKAYGVPLLHSGGGEC